MSQEEANDSPNTTDPHLLGLHRLMREKDEQISALSAITQYCLWAKNAEVIEAAL